MAQKKPSGPGIAGLLRKAATEAKQGAEARQEAEEAQEGELVVPVPGFATGVVPFKPKIFNILDYIESGWGLNMQLWPVQRFIVKLYYGIPLNSTVRNITLTDMLNTHELYKFTETEYLHYLHSEGRCNIGVQDHERRELILAIGRRGSKSTLSGIFASYEIYRLLNLNNPQGYYGLPGGNRIQIISVATDKDQAGILFNEVTSHLSRCEYFKPYIANNTLSYIQFRTPADIEKYGTTIRHENGKFTSFNGKATLRVTFKSCIAKGLRGAGNIVVILDEMAHFKDKGQSSAADIYTAVTPSTAAFSPKDPANTSNPIGPVESRVICISSPLNRTGKFYELFHQAMSGGPGSENMLAIQAPTWEINPTVPASYYRQKYHADPSTFMTEHGAQFSDRVRGWIERKEDLMACVKEDMRPKEVGMPRYPHSMGIDIGLVGDGSAVNITHVAGDHIELDYHEVWRAGEDWRETNPHLGTNYPTDYARKLKDVERLDFEEIARWIIALTKRFYIVDGLFDRWNGIPLEQALHKAGLMQFKSEFFTQDLSSRIYQNAKLMMLDRRILMYDYPKVVGDGEKHSPLIKELLTLQAERKSKNIVVVEAPDQPGQHDDESDAFVRSVWLSTQRLSVHNHATSLYREDGPLRPPLTVNRYQMMRARSHGIVRERLAPRSGMGRALYRGGR